MISKESASAAKTALITGGTSGIGEATAGPLHPCGDRVMVTGLGGPDNTALPADITAVKADIGSLADIDQALEQVREPPRPRRSPRSLAEAVAFRASDAGSYMPGRPYPDLAALPATPGVRSTRMGA